MYNNMHKYMCIYMYIYVYRYVVYFYTHIKRDRERGSTHTSPRLLTGTCLAIHAIVSAQGLSWTLSIHKYTYIYIYVCSRS